MAEYIEREAAIESIMSEPPDSHYPQWYADKIKNIPATDVAPVRHGRWIEYQIPPIICCSNCDWATGIEEKNFQHCPNCGARMDALSE